MQARDRRGVAMSVVAAVILVIGVAGVLLFMSTSGSTQSAAPQDIYVVQRGSFDITIPASGELAARRQLEVKNQLEERATVTEIVDEGIFVREGDILFRLNDEDIRNRIKDTEDAIDQSNNQLDNAIANLEIAQKTRESRLSDAELRIELANLAMQSWEQGDDVSRMTQLRLAIQTAELNHVRLKERYAASQDLFAEEFISKDELEQDYIRLIEAEARLEQAKLDLKVYEEYTRQRERKQRESEVNQAIDEKLRIDQRTQAEVDSALSDVDSRRRQLERNEERMETLLRQLSYCVVRAPSDGLVVYYSSLTRDRRRDTDPPEIGTELSRSETVIVLPDTTHMVAEVKVNEALSGLVERGQRASIISDAFPDRVFNGEVLSIGVLAESGGWRDPNRRDYTVRISIQGENDLGLRPSMRCRATIFIDKVEDTQFIPVQAIFRDGRRAFVYVPEQGGFAQREVQIGRSSELFVEITDGLSEGERVLLREPQTEQIIRTLPDLPPETDLETDTFDPDAAENEVPWEAGGGEGRATNQGQPSEAAADRTQRQRPQRPGAGGAGQGQRSGQTQRTGTDQ